MLTFFFIALLVNFGKTATPDEEVRQMLAELEIVSGPTMDVASTLKGVTKVSKPFLQAIHAVSNLAAAGMKSVFKPTSDEFEAMVYLNRKITEHFAEMDLNIERLRDSMNYDYSLRKYGDVVTLNLDIIEPTFLCVINSEMDPPIWRDDFLVQWLNLRVNKFCTMPTKCEAQIYSRINDLFFEIEGKVENDEAELRSPFYVQYKQMKMANQKMARLRTLLLEPNVTFMYFADVWERVKEDSSLQPSLPEKQCILKEAIETNQYKRESLVSTIEIVRRDIARLVMIAGMCANVSTGGSEKKMIQLFDEINVLVVGMFNKMEKWFKRKLELAWPNVILSHAKERYGKYSHLSKYQFNVTARSVLFSANERGPPEYLHSVLITRDWDTQEWFWAPCVYTSGCTKAMNWRGTHLVITRHPILALDRTINAHQWLANVRQNITEIIAANWKTDSLAVLLNQINIGIGGGIRPELFANVAFLHNSNLQADKCVIDYGIAGTIKVPNEPN
uniref:DHC_N1 domain-containing protein n=1 Tax=Globodera pallida TaxID=36090 RepID=A0A183BUA1_GLOPA